MSYTGNEPTTQSFVAGTDYFNGNGATTVFTLTREIGSVNDIEVSVDNVQVSPLLYSVLGNVLTLTVAPPAGSLNVVVRYLSTVLYQNLNTTNQGVGFLYNLIDSAIIYKPALITPTVVSVLSSTQISTSATGIAVGDVISASIANFSGLRVSAITPVVYQSSTYTLGVDNVPGTNTFTVNVTSTPDLVINGYVSFGNTQGSITYRILSKAVGASNTVITVTPNINETLTAGMAIYLAYLNVLTLPVNTQWGIGGTPVVSSIYRWTLPSNNVSLIYNQTTQKWQASTFIATGDASNNFSFGTNNLTALTSGTNNFCLGNSAGSAITTGSNKLIIGDFNGYVTNASPSKALDLRTSATPAVVVSDTNGAVRAVCDDLGRWGFGTTTPFGALDVAGLVRLSQASERVYITTDALTGTYNYNINNGSVLFLTTAATGNFSFNFTGDGSAAYTGTVNGLMQVGDSLTVAVITTQGATAYFGNDVSIDGSSTGITRFWQGPVAPSFGSPNGYDVYLFNIIKTASTPTYSILASRTQFGGS